MIKMKSRKYFEICLLYSHCLTHLERIKFVVLHSKRERNVDAQTQAS
jgi:hypothetical protein